MKAYKMTNRYGDKFTFTPQEDGTILWEGNFEYIRVGFPNDYTDAYQAYTTNGGVMGLNEFKEEVHRQIYGENDRWVGPCDIARVYGPMVKSKDEINMVDPSGGPYLTEGMVIKELSNKEIYRFESIKEGWKIYLK